MTMKQQEEKAAEEEAAAKPVEDQQKYPNFLSELLTNIKNKEPSLRQKTSAMLSLVRQNMMIKVQRYQAQDLYERIKKMKREKDDMQEMVENVSIELETIIESIEDIKSKNDLAKKLK